MVAIAIAVAVVIALDIAVVAVVVVVAVAVDILFCGLHPRTRHRNPQSSLFNHFRPTSYSRQRP